MKLEKIIYDIRERLSQYQDDSKITDEYIAHLIGIARDTVLKNELNSYQNILSPMIMQSFCMELEMASAYDCGIESHCETMLRTVKPLPTPIKTAIGAAITSVKAAGKLAKPIRIISKEQAYYVLDTKYNKSLYCFIDTDLRLYFVSKNKMHTFMDCIYVTGVFSDPFELKDYGGTCSCDGPSKECFNELEMDYPVTGDHVYGITNMVFEILGRKLEIPEDKVNDSNAAN